MAIVVISVVGSGWKTAGSSERQAETTQTTCSVNPKGKIGKF